MEASTVGRQAFHLGWVVLLSHHSDDSEEQMSTSSPCQEDHAKKNNPHDYTSEQRVRLSICGIKLRP